MPLQIFDRYVEELLKWNKSINLIQEKTEATIHERHIQNSLELKPLLNYENDTILDIGSGAGFPGLILAIDGAKHVHLVEPNTKKATFLNHIKNVYKLQTHVHNYRWQDLKQTSFSTVTSRAFAPLTELIKIMHFVSRETNKPKGLFLKGAKIQDEITEAKKNWRFQVEILQISTHNDGRIVKITEVEKR